MVSLAAIDKPHKTRTAKCKGKKVDPPDSYGEWAYWWGEGDTGWHNAPRPKVIETAIRNTVTGEDHEAALLISTREEVEVEYVAGRNPASKEWPNGGR